LAPHLQAAADHPPAHQPLCAAHRKQQPQPPRQRAVDRAACCEGRRWQRKAEPEEAAPHAVAVLHPKNEFEVLDAHVAVGEPELRGRAVLFEFRLPVRLRQRRPLACAVSLGWRGGGARGLVADAKALLPTELKLHAFPFHTTLSVSGLL
jgi:hypothetical protein